MGRGGSAETRGRDTARDDLQRLKVWSHGTAAVAAAIRSQYPDVVCLQEAGRYFWLTRPDQTPQSLEKTLPEYRFVASGEIMVGSRPPLIGSWMVPLPGPEARPAVIATYAKGRRVNVERTPAARGSR